MADIIEKKAPTSNEIARHRLLGEGEDPFKTQETEEVVTETETEETTTETVEETAAVVETEENTTEEAVVKTEEVIENVVNFDDIPDDKLLELVNKKFNTNFDTIDAASQNAASQLSMRGQEDIIQKLVAKAKENNVLSHFPNENAYKIAQLGKEYPGKDDSLARVVNSDISNLSDLEAITLAAKIERPVGSKVNALNYKLRQLGLTDDVSDFDNWDAMDKEVVIGAAEDARVSLTQLQNKIEVPSAEGGEVDEFVTGLESGFQETQAKQTELIEAHTPIATSMVDSFKTIKPVEGSEFEFTIGLDAEGKQDLTDFLVAESIEGGYDIKSDSDVRRLGAALEQEIMATEGKKIMEAYGKHVEQNTWDAAKVKYENAVPLDTDPVPVDPKPTVMTGNDRAKEILDGKR